jgi:hypothetical protein
MMDLVVLLELLTLGLGTVATDWGDVYHACTVLDEGAPLYWDLDGGEVGKAEVYETL